MIAELLWNSFANTGSLCNLAERFAHAKGGVTGGYMRDNWYWQSSNC